MSASQDFSRRFFADFIATRIRAWKLGELENRTGGGAVAAHDPSHPASPLPGTADAAAHDARRRMIPRLGTPGL